MTDLGLQMRHDDAPPRRRARRSRLAPLVVLLVLVGLLSGVVLGARTLVAELSGGPDDYPGPGSGEAVVQITPGQSAAEVGETLTSAGVVRTSRAFAAAAEGDDRSRGLQPGYYTLRKQMRAADALALLLAPASRLLGRVTLPEGLPLELALPRIASGAQIPLPELQKAIAAPSELGLPNYARGRPEGFLFPATYDVEPGTTAGAALAAMVDRYEVAADELDLAGGAAKLGRTPYEVLIVASLLEKEGVPGDYAKVARVIYNRLEAGQRLQLDSTVVYATGKQTRRLSERDLQVDTPYNTYRREGLPPTPINSPGEAALRAALQPAAGDWRYFVVAHRDGRSFFTADYQEFLAQKEKSQREGAY